MREIFHLPPIWYRRLAATLMLGYAAFLVAGIASDEGKFQPDFRVYYQAAKAWGEGINPYDPQSVSTGGESGIRHTYVYLLLPLLPLRLLASLPYSDAFRVFLVCKCLVLAGLLYMWRKILGRESNILFYAFCLLAFNGTLYLDFLTGNVSLFEQGALWLAFFFFAGGSLFAFCLLVMLAASFKVVPLLFLLLLWTTRDPRRHLYFIGSVACFVAIHSIPFIANPSLFPSFLKSVAGMEDAGIVNPSTASLLEALGAFLTKTTGLTVDPSVRWVLLGGIALAVLATTRRALRSVQSRPQGGWDAVFLACFVYALILPRFKDYSFILLLLPAYRVIRDIQPGTAQLPLFVLSILSVRHITLPYAGDLLDIVWDHFPLLLAYIFWWLNLRYFCPRVISS